MYERQYVSPSTQIIFPLKIKNRNHLNDIREGIQNNSVEKIRLYRQKRGL